MRYIDPSGLDSLLATQSEGVAGAGHTGYAAENYNDDGTKDETWTYYEATMYNKDRIENDQNEYKGILNAKFLGTVKVNLGRADDTLLSVNIKDFPAKAGFYAITFSDKKSLDAYLNGKGLDRVAEFSTSRTEDLKIHDFSNNDMMKYLKEYNFTDLNCSHVAARALANAPSIKPIMDKLLGWYPNYKFDTLKRVASSIQGTSIRDSNPSWRKGLEKTRDTVASVFASLYVSPPIPWKTAYQVGLGQANEKLANADELNKKIESEGRAY